MQSLTISERAARACRFRWLLAFGLRLQRKRRESAQRAGSLWHLALEGRWAGKDLRGCIWTVENRLANDVRRGLISDLEARELSESIQDTLIRYDERWSTDSREFEVLAVEEWISARVRTASGRKGRTMFGGVLDRVIVDRSTGSEWLVEHKAKTNGVVSERDLERRRSEPQAAQYALLWKEKTGRSLAGVVYDYASLVRVPSALSWPVLKVRVDLSKRPPRGARPETVAAALAYHDLPRLDWHDELEASLAAVPSPEDWPRTAKGLARKVPANARPETLEGAVRLVGAKPEWFEEVLSELSFVARPEDWQTVQRGKPGLAKLPPAGAVPATLRAALAVHGFEFGSQDWHVEVEEELARFESSLFVREWVRFSEREIELSAREVHFESTEVERDRRLVEPYRAAIANTASTVDGTPVGALVEVAVEELGPRFPRNGHVCWEYGRLCAFADICSTRDAHAARVLRVKGALRKEEEEVSESEDRRESH